jgi:hypothetical protein
LDFRPPILPVDRLAYRAAPASLSPAIFLFIFASRTGINWLLAGTIAFFGVALQFAFTEEDLRYSVDVKGAAGQGQQMGDPGIVN